MLLSRVKKLCQKGASFAIKALPVIVPAFLLFHTNSTCCIVNGQPTPPNQQPVLQLRKVSRKVLIRL